MKLNLLPTYVSKEKQARFAIVFAAAILFCSVALAVMMVGRSKAELAKAQEPIDGLTTAANQAKSTADSANDVIAEAKQVSLNVNLATAMEQHNDVYPKFYASVRPYIPSFFRITNETAQPIDGKTAQLTLTGVIKTYQEYADLMLALLRIPGAQSVGRAGFQNVQEDVQPLGGDVQTSVLRKPGDQPLPKDIEQQIAAMGRQGNAVKFTGVGNFGTTGTAARGAMPNYSLITVSVVMPGSLQTPDPRATLAQSTAAGGATAPTSGNTLTGGSTTNAPTGGAGQGKKTTGKGNTPPPPTQGATGRKSNRKLPSGEAD